MRVTRSLARLVRVGLCAAAMATGAADCPASAMPARPIRFTRLSLEQGLSQSTVLCVFQDSRGYIWLGTEDGLNRFDGVKFTVYKNDPAAHGLFPEQLRVGDRRRPPRESLDRDRRRGSGEVGPHAQPVRETR